MISKMHYRALERAVAIARAERYNRIGHPDLAAFDEDIKLMDAALTKLRQRIVPIVRAWSAARSQSDASDEQA